MAPQSNAPVIIRRKKVVSGDGHHGGAWKVAYADFVTAMMAFFMLMWLLGATTEKQRKGIADYFNPTIPLVRASGGGSGAFGGETAFSESSLSQTGTGAAQSQPTEQRQSRGDTGLKNTSASEASEEERALSELAGALRGIGGESMVTELMQRHVVTRLSDEGLVIELFGSEADVLFEDGAEPSVLLSDLTTAIVPLLGLVRNDIAIHAHAPAVPLVRRENQTWSVTSERADRTRVMIEALGFPSDRIARISGFGSAQPADTNPMAVRNDRLEIVILRSAV